MKGLIIKDLMCLRKQRTTFIFTVIAIIVLGIMYVLSVRFGNIHYLNQQMMSGNGLSVAEINSMCTMVLVLFMMLPIALVGDVVTVFIYDGKAGFANVSATLPLSVNKRVMAKFLTVMILFCLGVATDLVISFLLSFFTDILSFLGFLGIIFSAASVMSIYGSFTIFYCFLLGYGKESYAQILSILTMITSFVLVNFSKIKMIMIEIIAPEVEESDISFLTDIMEFIKQRFYVLFFIAVIVMLLSYAGTVTVAKRKRGMI